MKISGIEAHFLLFALDKYLGVDAKGGILSAKHGYSREALQDLRDRLFKAHDHPEWERENEQNAVKPDEWRWPDYD